MAYFQSDSDNDSLENLQCLPNTYDISILKHLEKPNSILQKQTYDFLNPKCLYQTPLCKISQTLKLSQTEKPNNARLMGLQQTQYEHQKIKQKITKIFSKNQKGLQNGTLWDIYGSIAAYYMRFTNNNRKNFANVVMDINGVSIPDKIKKSSKMEIPKLISTYSQAQNGPVRFDSHFESGNLLYVFRKPGIIDTYDIILQNDINTKGHNQWFFFKMQNQKKNHKVKINIVNMIKNDSLFNYGQKILVYSEYRNKKTGKGWMREGERITYQENNIRRQNKQTNHYTLSFQYTFKEQNDTIYMCPSYPYTFSNLSNFLEKIFKKSDYNQCISIKNIAQTIGGNKVNLVSISTGRKDINQKNAKIIWILARQHPSETTSSFMVQGIIEYLVEFLSEHRKKMEGSKCYSWVDDYHFKILPMVNIDGVIHGNSRSELTGVDPNRMWYKPLKRLASNVRQIKKHILQTKGKIDMILDLHSHSKKTGCFFYGNTVLYNPNISKIYPTFVCQNDERFSFKNCRFRGGYETTLRRVLFSQLNNMHNIFTVQCSLYGYQKDNKVIDYTPNDLKAMGSKLISAYFNLQKVKRQKQIQKIIQERPQIQQWKDGVDSARSQSSLSDEEYNEIFKVKKKKKPKHIVTSNKIKISKSINSGCADSKILDTSNLQQRIKTFTNYQKILKINQTKITESRKLPKKQNLCSFPAISDPERAVNQNFKKYIHIRNIVRARVQDKQKKQIQVQKEFYSIGIQANLTPRMASSKSNSQLDNKQHGVLCVVGSSMQDQRCVVVNKNEIGTQIYNEQSQNYMKNSKSNKIPKLLNYVASNILGNIKQNGVYPQQKKIAQSQIKYNNIGRNVFAIRN